MKLLVLDTAQGLCTAAVATTDGQILAACSETMGRGHQERLPELVQAVLARAGVGVDALDVIAATRGPGSFTGLRVGLAFAQGLAAASGARGIGLSSLKALAMQGHQPARGQGRGVDPEASVPLVGVMDARRGQVYLGAWAEGAGGWRPLLPESAMALETARDCLAGLGPDMRLVGSGAALVAGDRVAGDGVIEDRVKTVDGPDAEALARLAILEIQAGAGGVAGLEPLYLRAPDATPPTRLPGTPRR